MNALVHRATCTALAGLMWLGAVDQIDAAPPRENDRPVPEIAAVVTEYRQNTHADVIVSRLLRGYGLDDRSPAPLLKLVSLYADQVPPKDLSRPFAAKYGFPVFDDVTHALIRGGDRLAVDGVLLVAEHGTYPESDTGQVVYPKRRLFTEVVKVFEQSNRVVPVFIDKHLADNWQDAKWIYDTAQRLEIPLMAGSSLPATWRDPPVDVGREAALKEIVVVSYGPLDAYGFHALEAMQALAERRKGGETGVRAVQCLVDEAVWRAGRAGVFDRRLLDAALERLKDRPLPAGKTVEDLVPHPVLFVVDYRDGLRANVLTLNGAVAEWAAAWRWVDEREPVASTLFWVQQGRPYDHFSNLVEGIETMMQTSEPAWPVERTLLTSGLLDALLISKRDGGRKLATPWLDVRYRSKWNWSQPAAPRNEHEPVRP